MTERPCLRCQSPLTLDGGQLTYCSICGAPQIFLSEELQLQAAEEHRSYSERSAAVAAEAADVPTGNDPLARLRRARGVGAKRWPVAVEYALLSGGIALGLCVGGILFAPLLLIAWLWMISAPMLTVGFYSNRSRDGALSGGFAARLGLLTGLLVLLGSAVVFTLGMLLARFAFHSHEIDSQLAAAFAQVTTTTRAQYGETGAPVIRLLGVPEFQVGFLLWMVAVSSALYLLLAGITAGLAGMLLSRRRMA